MITASSYNNQSGLSHGKHRQNERSFFIVVLRRADFALFYGALFYLRILMSGFFISAKKISKEKNILVVFRAARRQMKVNQPALVLMNDGTYTQGSVFRKILKGADLKTYL